MYKKDTCSIRTRMEEGDKIMEEEVDSAQADMTKDKPPNKISTIDRTSQTRKEEHLVEGGAIIPDQDSKTTPSSVDNVEIWPLRGKLSEKEKWVGPHKPKTHQLRLKLRL